MKKKVYTAFSVDILHDGHINILKYAAKYGEVIVGLLTDEAIASYKSLPHLSYQKRKYIIENVKYVSKVIPQTTLDYTNNLKKIKPNFVVHGDDWKTGYQKKIRGNVIKTLKAWSGKLLEPKYTKNISSSIIKDEIFKMGTTPDIRKTKLKRLIDSKKIVRILEAHNPISGLIAEKISYTNKKNLKVDFDGMWSSSLTDSSSRGKPDNQSVDYSTRYQGLNEILEVTTKPLIFDADNGGRLEHISYMVKTLERSGVSAMIIEDKIGLKKNSLFKNQKGTLQDSIINFSKKIRKAKSSAISEDFMVIARIESFILGKGLKDALRRAEKYSKAGADGILIHSKEKTPHEIFSFAKIYNKKNYAKPLVCVPSTYSSTYEKDLIKNNFKIVIYANHMLRSAYPSMTKTALSILKHKRAYESDDRISSINEIINLIK